MRKLSIGNLCIAATICLMWPSLAAAHAANRAGWWTLDPLVLVPMAGVCLLYAIGIGGLRSRRHIVRAARPLAIALFSMGMAFLFLALVWPLDALSEHSFAAHMAQHMILMAVAPTLLVVSDAGVPLLTALLSSWRGSMPRISMLRRCVQRLAQPRVAFALHAAMIWLWHAPGMFDLALNIQWVHVLEHVAFFGSALIFWAALWHAGRAGGEGYGAGALWVLATLMHTGLLGALITFAPVPLYEAYVHPSDLTRSSIEDQQLAGLIMWIAGGALYLLIGLGFAAAWMREAARTTPEKSFISDQPSVSGPKK